jgi:hypothetical protein
VDPIIDKSQLRQNPIKIESKSFTTKNAKSFGSGAMQALAIDTSGSPNSKTAKKIAFASDFNRRPHLIVNKNSSNKTKEKSSDENDITKLDLEKSMIIANDLRQQLKHSYKINSKESAKFRQELEKYRNIFVGAYEN